jgi:glycosyltransferase involved in cell wall biosynthesis
LKVLVSAYACQPGTGSEAGGGWNWMRQIGRFEQCWVITRLANRAAIDAELARNPMPGVHFIYYDLPRWARFWKKGVRGVRAYYCLWQLGAYRVAKKLHREVRFDLVHHLTFASYCLPTFLPFLPAPFIWGPVGGAETTPRSFRRAFGVRGQLYEMLRGIARQAAELNPVVRLTARRAVAGLATTPQTALRLKALGCRNVSVASQVALSSQELSLLQKIPPRKNGPFRIVSVGRLLHWKGFELGIQAFAIFQRKNPQSEYWIVGDGPEKQRWQRLAEDLGVAKNMAFWPAIPRSKVLDKIAHCDVLLHPSLHDSGGWVTAEAMAVGRPVICLDLGGPALQVTQATGIKVPAISPRQAAADIANALEQIAKDSLRGARFGEEGRARVQRHFNSEHLGHELSILYSKLVRV